MFDSKQDRDCWLELDETRYAHVRYLFFRSAESRAAGAEGQDYLFWREGFGDSLLFAVCDGVGSSFCGNIASRFLAVKLIELLDDSGPKMDQMCESELQEHMLKYLGLWQKDGHRLVQEEEIQAPPDSLIEKALQQQREEYGSETVFVCGRLSFGAQTGRLLLVWMGDCEVQAFDPRGFKLPIAESNEWVASDRWSTRWGARKKGSRLHTRIFDLQQHKIARVLVHSDGLSTKSELLAGLGDDELHHAVLDLVRSPKSDDISFVDFALKPMAEPTELEAPVAKVEISADRVRLGWSTVGGAKTYEVQVDDDALFLRPQVVTQVKETELELEPDNRTRFFRVRGLAEAQRGAWSRGLRCRSVLSPRVHGEGEGEDGFLLSWEAGDDIELCVITEIVDARPHRVFLEPAASGRWLASNLAPGRYAYEVEFVNRRGGVSEPSRRLTHQVSRPGVEMDAPLENDPEDVTLEADATEEGSGPNKAAALIKTAASVRPSREGSPDEALDVETAIENLQRPRSQESALPASEAAVPAPQAPEDGAQRPSDGVDSNVAIQKLQQASFPARETVSVGLTLEEGVRNLQSGFGSSSRFDEAKSESEQSQQSRQRRSQTTTSSDSVGSQPISNPMKASRFKIDVWGIDVGGRTHLWESECSNPRTAYLAPAKTAQFCGGHWLVSKSKPGIYYYWIKQPQGRANEDPPFASTEVRHLYPSLDCEEVGKVRVRRREKPPSCEREVRLMWGHCKGVKGFRLLVRSSSGQVVREVKETRETNFSLFLQPGNYEVELEPLGSGHPYVRTGGTLIVWADTGFAIKWQLKD